MSLQKVRVLLVVAAILMTAGCGSMAGDSETPNETTQASAIPPTTASSFSTVPTNTQTPSQSAGPVVLRQGTLPFNESRTYIRVTQMLNGEVRTVPVSIVNRSESGSGRCRQLAVYTQFGVECHGGTGQPVGGSVGLTSTGVTLSAEPNASATALESVLAHEFVHVEQQHRDLGIDAVRTGGTTDHVLVASALIEGQAAYVNKVYNERFLDNYTTFARSQYEDVHGYYRAGVYYFGGRYFDQRVPSPAASWQVFQTPPNTTEQVIHGYAPSAEPPTHLNTTVSVTGRWNRFDDPDRLGELAIRNLLRTNLSDSTATTAAAGWGNDKLVGVVDRNGTRGYVWLLNWDTPADATEFQSAFRTFANRTTEREGVDQWRKNGTEFQLIELNDETLLVTIGPPELAVIGAGNGTNVTVTSNHSTESLGVPG